jgi:hypothetical protein
LIKTDPHVKQKYRHYSHAFAPKHGKDGLALLQAADILAWEWMRDRQNTIELHSRPRRLSLTYLLRNIAPYVCHMRLSELELLQSSTAKYNLRRWGGYAGPPNPQIVQ